jgi:hypothetical protein
MTQQASVKAFFLFLVFIWVAYPVASQKKTKNAIPDTVFIYETQVVYDTLFVYDTIWMPKPLVGIPVRLPEYGDPLSGIIPFKYDTASTADTVLFGKTKEKYYYTLNLHKPFTDIPLTALSKKYSIQPANFLCKSPATNFKKSIISVKNNEKLMKSERNNTTNTNPFTWGILAGGGGWWARSFDGNLRTNVLVTPHVGVYYEKTITRNVRFKLELNYTWIVKKGIQFNQGRYLDSIQSPSTPGITDSDIFRWDVDGDKDTEFSFSQIDVPVKVGYTIGLFQPYIGFEYTRRFVHDKVHNGNYFSVLAGADVHLSKRVSLGVCYSRGLQDEIQRNGQVQGIVVNNIITLPGSKVAFAPYPPAEYLSKNTGFLSSQRINLSLYFNLHSN